MGLGGEYLGVSVPAPLALHAGREPTCGVNSRAAVNHRRLSTRVRRTWARVGRDGSRRRAERAHQFQSAGPVRVLGAVSHGAYLFRSMSLSCGDRPGVLRVTALNSTPVIFYPTDSVTFDRTPSALRLPPIPVGDTGRVPHHEPFTRVHPLSPHIVSSEMRLGNASLTADLERLAACARRFASTCSPTSRCFERFVSVARITSRS